MQTLEAALLETAGGWEQDVCAGHEDREIIGAVAETFLAQMLVVFMDLRPGALLLEEVAADRTYATWKPLGDERLLALGAGVRYRVSDRAKALLQLAEQGCACLSMPDFFHVMSDLVQSYALAIARRGRPVRQEWTKAAEVRSKPRPLAGSPQALLAAQHQVEGRRAEVQRWEGVHST